MTATRDDIPIEQGERFSTTPEEAELLGRLWDRQLPGHLSEIPEKCPKCRAATERFRYGIRRYGCKSAWDYKEGFHQDPACRIAELKSTVAELAEALGDLVSFVEGAAGLPDPELGGYDIEGELAEARAALAKLANPPTIEHAGYGDGTVVSSDEPLGDCPKEKRP